MQDSPAWGTLPLVFDRRDVTREAAVKEQLLARSGGKPYVLLALSGTSSPFAPAHELARSEEHTSELQSRQYLVCRLLLEKKKKTEMMTSGKPNSTSVNVR